jgi:tetratricopeptide (TPR) repeat protein
MTNITHTVLTPTDTANAEALKLWDECHFEEAAAHLEAFLEAAHDLTPVEQLRTRNNRAMFARARRDFREALRIHNEAEPFADACADPLVRGKFHNGRALTRQNLGDRDEAIIEFTAASIYYQEAREHGLVADVENNLAVLHAEAGRPAEAMEHLAVALGSCPPGEAGLAQYEDTRALIALAAGDARAALEFSNSSVGRLLPLGDNRLIVESVRTSVRAGRAFLHDQEEAHVRETLGACRWNLTRAAHRLGFNSRQALENHLRRNFPALDEERRNRSVASREP